MKVHLYTIVNNVEGVVSAVHHRFTLTDAVALAVTIALEQQDGDGETEVRGQLQEKASYTSRNGDIIVSIDDDFITPPEPKRRKPTLKGGKRNDPHLLSIEVPVIVTFTTDPEEMDDREGERKPSKTSLVKYMKDALILELNNEEYGQPDGASFAAAGVDWGKAVLVRG